jgi:hypothetical protein
MRRYPVACAWDGALWRYELLGKSENNVNRQALSVVETAQGEPVGFLAHSTRLWQGRVGIMGYELKPGVSWSAVTPSVMRYLWALGERWATSHPDKELEVLNLWLGVDHPAFQAMHKRLPHTMKPYAWYLRVPDLPAFLRHVAGVLEQRLAASALVGHSGELRISFYRDGVRLAFEEGRLSCVEPWQSTREESGDAAFPDLTFLQLLFGYRSLEELEYAFADCWTSGEEGRALLAALFPKCPSDVWPVS